MSNIIDSIQVSGVNYTLSAASGGASAVEVTQAEYDALVTSGTVDPTVFYIITDASPADMSQYWTSAQTNSAITEATSGKVDTSTFNTYSGNVETALSGKQDALSVGTGINITNNVISVSGVVMSSEVTSAVTSGSTAVITSGGVYAQLGGLKLVKLTQSAYDALSPNYDSNTLYVIVN